MGSRTRVCEFTVISSQNSRWRDRMHKKAGRVSSHCDGAADAGPAEFPVVYVELTSDGYVDTIVITAAKGFHHGLTQASENRKFPRRSFAERGCKEIARERR